MLKIQYKMPWFITNNNTYGFTDKNVWEAMQDDFTFYIEFQMNPENNQNNHTIFCRPGMHMGVFVKNQEIITWDFWNNNGINNFNDIAFFVGKENIHKKYLMVVSHNKEEKRFSCHLKCTNDETIPIIYQEKVYDGTLHDYTDELTRYKAYDNSGNCYNLEINVGLIKKIFKYNEHETINLNHINKEKEII